ncbi:hypothetical protein CBR_g19716 [Chara braunii]|uniref:Uncharacterized protein n=1 Tax=Chara braunii TaxID=69332 RepID=A0A388KZ25_CHABU|nr:hypothetical protein CBR_g19716 [Chara braunii]|eukprot:GBG75203.1 hypothetical protein CBR_g19716 [Chara braunii]
MVRSQARVFKDVGEDENRKAKKKCCVYKYIRVGQTLSERFCENRMLKCLFCGHEFQGNQFVSGRHFRQGKGCLTVTDEALVDIHYNTECKLDGKILERMRRFEELHGPAFAMDLCWDEGWVGEMEFKKRWLRFVYSQRLSFNIFRSEPWLDVVRHFRELSGPLKVLWPSENEIADIETIVHMADDVAANLAEVRAPFYVTGATIMSDERNWTVHEGVQTKKHNRLEFEKVAKLVEISANVLLLSPPWAGLEFALSWTLNESLLDVEGGIGTRRSWKGTRDSSTQEELECQRRSWQRDPCGSRAPPSEVADVFRTRGATLRPYPRDDDNDYEGREQEDERAGPTTSSQAAQEADEWSDPEDVRRRSGGDDFFGGVDLQGEEELWCPYGSPVERQRPTSPGL